MTPKDFIIVYECEECDQEYELSNCLVDKLPIWCDECHKITYWYSEKIIPKSWHLEIDRIEEGLTYDGHLF